MCIVTRTRSHALIGIVCLAMAAPTVLAQTSSSPPVAPTALQIPKLDPPRTAADSAAVVKAAAIADTGRMMPGYRDISRYDTPGYCVAAMIGLDHEMLRKHERDTLATASPHDSLAPAAIVIGKQCARRFTVQNTDPHELFNIMQLSLMTGDTATKVAAVNRRLALATTPEARGNVLLDAVEALLKSKPIRPELATTMVARMDSLGPAARIPRWHGHKLLFASGWWIADTVVIAREIEAHKTIRAMFTSDEKREFSDALFSLNATYVLWFRHAPTIAADVTRLLQQDFIPTSLSQGAPENQVQAIAQRVIGLASSIGTPAPTLAMQHAFNAGSDKVKPAPGKVTLLWKVDKGNGVIGANMTMLRRLHDKYAAQGLDIVLIEGTQGYSWSSPPQTPSDEAASDAWYYLDYLNLPFTLVVQETPYKHLPDGRRVDGRIPFDEQYMSTSVLIGRDQKIFTQGFGVDSEEALNMMVRMALAAKGSR